MQNAYVLVDPGYVFAFLGKSADTEQLKKALYEAEMFSMTAEVENAWQMVCIHKIELFYNLQYLFTNEIAFFKL